MLLFVLFLGTEIPKTKNHPLSIICSLSYLKLLITSINLLDTSFIRSESTPKSTCDFRFPLGYTLPFPPPARTVLLVSTCCVFVVSRTGYSLLLCLSDTLTTHNSSSTPILHPFPSFSFTYIRILKQRKD